MDFDFTQPVDAIDKVPEQFRSLYDSNAEGKFVVKDDFKGVATALSGLNTSLKAARAEAKSKTPTDLSALAEYGADPASIKAKFDETVHALQEQITKGGDAKQNLEKIKQDLAAGHAKEIEKVTRRSEALQTQLYGLLVENAATTAVAELKGIPELLLPFIKQQVVVKEENGEFKVYVVDSAGDQRYSGLTGSPMSIKELVAEMKANEKYGRLFESDQQQGGGGMNPGGGRRTPPAQKGTLSPNDKISRGIAALAGRR